jgi:hypothetical protein
MTFDGDQAVLVPVVLGAGLLFSLATLARDLVHRARGHRWLDRRRFIEGRATASLVRGGLREARRDQTGLRARWVYRLIAAAFGGFAVYVVRGSWGNFVGWTWWAEGISWLFCVMLAAGFAFGALGATALALALRWDQPPTWTRAVLVRTPMGAVPSPAARRSPPPR